MEEYKVYFHGSEVSKYGIEQGFVDYNALRGAVRCCIMNNFIMEETSKLGLFWDTLSGYSYFDSDGEKYTYDEAQERISELKEMLENDPENTFALQWEEDIELLEEEDIRDDILQYYIVTEAGAEFLMKYTNDFIFYNEELDIYLWGITHFGSSWEIELTNIPISECQMVKVD